jgi:4-amino-4-deoxy-L-arabinose transferase-like glycosyltransferase
MMAVNKSSQTGRRPFSQRFGSKATSLALILVVALGLRVGFAWNYASHNPRQALSVIPFMFESGNIAASIAKGNGFSSPFRVDTGPTAWMAPVYPLLLAGVFRVFGTYTFNAYIAAVGLNILFSTLTCIPIFFAGKRVASLGVGAGAAWLWAIFPNAIQIPAESMWDACLAALLAATILWSTLELADSQRVRDWCAYGLLWGLALMTNPTLASLLPFLFAWMVWRAYKWQEGARISTPLSRPLLALATAALCCVPWTIRNYEVFHRFVPLRSILGLQLAMGNNADAKDFWLGEGHPIHDSAEREKYVEMGEIAYMQEKQHEAMEYIASHPRRELHLIWVRFVSLWAGGATHPVRDFFLVHSLYFRGVLLFNIFAAIGAIGGIVALVWRRNIYAFPIAIFPIIFPWAYYLTLSLPRYRLPIDPAVMLLTAFAIASASSLRKMTVAMSDKPRNLPR